MHRAFRAVLEKAYYQTDWQNYDFLALTRKAGEFHVSVNEISALIRTVRLLQRRWNSFTVGNNKIRMQVP